MRLGLIRRRRCAPRPDLGSQLKGLQLTEQLSSCIIRCLLFYLFIFFYIFFGETKPFGNEPAHRQRAEAEI